MRIIDAIANYCFTTPAKMSTNSGYDTSSSCPGRWYNNCRPNKEYNNCDLGSGWRDCKACMHQEAKHSIITDRYSKEKTNIIRRRR